MFDSPQEAAQALAQEFGITITPQSAERYDPTKRAGERLAKHLCELFERTRKEFLERLDAIPHANKAVRIRKLAKAADTFEAKGNLVAMSEMLVLIAKERGGCFTNQREFSGRNGKAIEHDIHDRRDISDQQLNARLATYFGIFAHLGQPGGVSEESNGGAGTEH